LGDSRTTALFYVIKTNVGEEAGLEVKEKLRYGRVMSASELIFFPPLSSISVFVQAGFAVMCSICPRIE